MVKYSLIFFATLLASAGTITTNSGFLGTYTGPQNQDLNVKSAEVFFDGSNFEFTSTLGAAVGATSGVDYIWGVDRGLLANEANFGAFAPGVLFDAVVVLFNTGGGVVDDIAGGSVITPLAAGSVTINGSTITAIVPLSMLASNALTGAQYQVNLWPSLGIPGPLSDIAEFAPSVNSDAAVTVTPEPAGLGLLGLGLIGLAMGRNRLNRG
jgi:hypothetical protein